MHLLMVYAPARVLAFVSALTPARREVVHMVAVTALSRRIQLGPVDSPETSRAGLVAIAAIPILRDMAEMLKWELKAFLFPRRRVACGGASGPDLEGVP
jgi:hypothetical protein